MMADTTTLFMRDIGLKMLGLEINKDIARPRIKHADEEQSLIEERIFGLSIFISMWKVANNLCKHQIFLSFGLNKFKIEFLKENDPF